MKDLIERQAAIEVVDAVWSVTGDKNIAKVWDQIKDLPSAQPERIRGRWIKISPAGIYECSVCGQNVMTGDIDVYHYCHGCGADMRGEQDG